MVMEAVGAEILKRRLQRPSEHGKREGFPGMVMLGYAVVRGGEVVS